MAIWREQKTKVLGRYWFFLNSDCIIRGIWMDNNKNRVFIMSSHFFSLKFSLLIYPDFDFDMWQIYFNILLGECHQIRDFASYPRMWIQRAVCFTFLGSDNFAFGSTNTLSDLADLCTWEYAFFSIPLSSFSKTGLRWEVVWKSTWAGPWRTWLSLQQEALSTFTSN